MRLPLLLHCKPRLVTGPIVLLQKGTWIIEARNLVDSEINLNFDNPTLSTSAIEWTPCYHNKELVLEDDTKICIRIIKAGSESEITVYAFKKLK